MKLVPMFVAIVLMVSLASVALARGAPTNENAFSDQSTVSVHVAPTVANVPIMTGFDVIENISTPAFPRFAIANQPAADTSGMREQSTTGDERSRQSASTSYTARSGPNLASGLRV